MSRNSSDRHSRFKRLIAQVLAGFVPALFFACRSSDPVGTWEIANASTENGQAYVGVVNVTAANGGFHVVWNTSIDDHEGSGILIGNALYACFSERRETCTLLVVPAQGPGFSFDGSTVTRPDVDRSDSSMLKLNNNSQTIEFKSTGAGLSAVLTSSGKTIQGAGLRVGDVILLGFGAGTGVAEYVVSGSAVGHRFTVESGRRGEKLERASVGAFNVKFKGKFK